MENAYRALCDIVKIDPAQRGLSENYEMKSDIEALAKGLAAARGVVLISGFPVRTERGPVGETDGPIGISWLARALDLLGVPVRGYTGKVSYRWRWYDSQNFYISTRRTNTCGHRCSKHSGRNTRIHSNYKSWLPGIDSKRCCRCSANLHRQLASQFVICNSSYAIRSEQSAHSLTPANRTISPIPLYMQSSGTTPRTQADG